MKRRKHRLVVELTLTHPVTEIWARRALSLLLDRIDTTERVWLSDPATFADKIVAKEFSRVHRAQIQRERREAAEHMFHINEAGDKLARTREAIREEYRKASRT